MSKIFRVVNVQNVRRNRDRVLYVGRAFDDWPLSPWFSMFDPADFHGDHAKATAKFSEWLDMFQESNRTAYNIYINALSRACGDGERPLGCVCVPLEWDTRDSGVTVCHAQELAIRLDAMHNVRLGTADELRSPVWQLVLKQARVDYLDNLLASVDASHPNGFASIECIRDYESLKKLDDRNPRWVGTILRPLISTEKETRMIRPATAVDATTHRPIVDARVKTRQVNSHNGNRVPYEIDSLANIQSFLRVTKRELQSYADQGILTR